MNDAMGLTAMWTVVVLLMAIVVLQEAAPRSGCRAPPNCRCTKHIRGDCGTVTTCPEVPHNHRGNITDYIIQLDKNTCALTFNSGHEMTLTRIAWEHFSNLRKIYFINASIVNVDEFFSNANTETKSKINTLFLDFNSIRSISKDTFLHFLSLTTLSLKHNGIETLDALHFWHLHNLMKLGLEENRLHRLESGHFSNLTKLSTLHLESNSMNFIHRDTFRGLNNLKEIYLNYNNLTFIDSGTFALPRLRVIHFDSNKLEVLTKSVLEAPSLQTVSLSHNFIRLIRPDAISVLTTIRMWYLENNSLTSIPDAMIEKHNFNHEAQKPEIERHLQHIKSEKNLNCTFPLSKTVWNITDLDLKNLTCDNDSLIPAESCSKNENTTYNPEACNRLQNQTCSSPISVNSCVCGFEKNCFVCQDKFYGIHSPVAYHCSPCPGLKSGGYGAQHFNQCQCLPGFEEMDGECQECSNSTYKADFGPQPCSPCLENSEIWHSSLKKCSCAAGYIEMPDGTCREPVIGSPSNTSMVRSHTEISNHVNGTSQDTIVIIVAIISGFVVFIFMFSLLLYRLAFKNKLKRHKKGNELVLHNINVPHATENTYVNLDSSNGLMVELHQIKFEQLLGQGAFGLVHKATVTDLKNQTGITTAAIKSLRVGHSEEDKTALYTELQQLLYVGHHPNIINLLGFVSTDETFMIIIEYASYGDLLSYLKGKTITTQYADLQFPSDVPTNSYLDMNNSPYMQPNCPSSRPEGNNNCVHLKTLLAIAWQVTKGMNHLAEMKCIHRDLAGRNVLLSSGLVAKVSDFGLARAVYECGYYFKETKGRLPFKWMPLEAILEGHYTTKSDVWSFGILLWEIFTLGGNPYPGVPIKSLLDLLQSGYRMAKPGNCPDDVYEVMQNCWTERPCERPNFNELADSLEKILQKTANSDYMEIHAGDNDDISCPSPAENDDFSESELHQAEEALLHHSAPMSSQYAELVSRTYRTSENAGLLSEV